MIVEFTSRDITGIEKLGVDRLLVNLSADGNPEMELGFHQGKVVHRYPDCNGRTYSLLGDCPVIVQDQDAAKALEKEFWSLWNRI